MQLLSPMNLWFLFLTLVFLLIYDYYIANYQAMFGFAAHREKFINLRKFFTALRKQEDLV